MIKKQSKTLTFLGYFLICTGVLGLLLYFGSYIIFIVFNVLYIVCGIGIVKRFKWAGYATICVTGAVIVYQGLWCSPVFHKERIALAEARYRRCVENAKGESLKESQHDDFVLKSEYLALEREKVEKVKENSFLFWYMLIRSVMPVLVIVYLSRQKIREEFKKQQIAEI